MPKRDINGNPIQSHYDDKFGIKKAEERGSVDGTGSNSKTGVDGIRGAEQSPSGSWETKVVGPSSPIKSGGPMNFIKKKSPMLAIIITIVGSGVLLSGPSISMLLPMAVGSNLVQKFNIQETSATIRTNKLLVSKITSGPCTSFVKITCRFTTPSNRFLKQLEKNGITALDKNGNKIIGKKILPNARTSKLSYTNSAGEVVDVSAKNLASVLKSDAQFRTGLHNASMTRFASLADEIFMKIKMRFGFTVADKLNTRVKADIDANSKTTKSLEAVIEDNIDIDQGVKKAIKNGGSEATGILKDVLTKEATAQARQLSKGTSAIAMTVSAVCLVSDAPGLITKTVRGFQLAQLVRYSAVFLTAFGAMRASEASAEEVSVIGNALTQTSTNGKSAMDSSSMSYIMNNDSIMQSNNYKKYAPGVAVIAALAGVMAITNSAAKKKVCRTVGNPLTGASIDAALALNAGETLGITALIAALDIVGGWALGKYLDEKLPGFIDKVVQVVPVGDIMNGILGSFVGDLTKGLAGEDVGDALVSGASHLMGQTGNQGGNMPLSVDQAVAYAETTKQVQLAYAEEDRATMSPLDPSSPNTMMGMMIQKLIPYTTSSFAYSSIPNTFATISKIALGSVGTILQPVTATAADPSAEYTQCDDPELKDNDIAAGPFCNIIYGVPPKYLDKDPVKVLDELIASGDVDEETGEPVDKLITGFKPSLKYWLEMCTDGKTAQANSCKITDETANFALYTIDHRIQKSMDEELPTSVASTTGNTNSNTSTGEYGSKTAKELAQIIIKSGNVTDRTGQVKQVANGTRTNIDTKVLRIIAELSKDNKFTISSMRRDYVPKNGSKTSQHLSGEAVDFSGSAGINGATIAGYADYNSKIQKFIDDVAQLLGNDCHQIGVPNNKYKTNTKNLSSKCSTFVDLGTAPHIHVGVSG